MNLLHAVEKHFDDAGANTATLVGRDNHDASKVEMECAVTNNTTDADGALGRECAN